MSEIPLCIPEIGKDEVRAVEEVLLSGWLAHGEKNKEFEEQFRVFVNTDYAVSMNSCTSALYVALLGMGIRGEVIVPSFTFVASVNAIMVAGAEPVLVDIERSSRNIDPKHIRAAVTDRTEAIMVVHYGGLPANMPEIIQIAEEHGLRGIEDSAECLGGRWHDNVAGGYDVGCFSFFPTKNVVTGEGGMLTTNDEEVARKAKALCGHGIDSTTFARERQEKPWVRIASMAGFNFRMSNVLAAIGVEQMKKLSKFNEARSKLAERYCQRLATVENVELQSIPSQFESSWQMFTILVPSRCRDQVLKSLRDNGVYASVHFAPPVHLQPPYRSLKRGPLEVTEHVASEIITLPMYAGMKLSDVDRVCDLIELANLT